MKIYEYIWIDGKNGLRSKARTGEDIPTDWDYDGSSTYQADPDNSEVILTPKSTFSCPFRGGPSLLVMCDSPERRSAADICTGDHAPWYGMEQEFFIVSDRTAAAAATDGDCYCGVGTGNVFHRDFIDKFYNHCIDAGLKISGVNAEVAPGQWEYQIGPVEGIVEAGDQLWVSRYILHRLAEEFNLIIHLDPKPPFVGGDCNYSGCHVNFSTLDMRESKIGFQYIMDAIHRLAQCHDEHLTVYGTGNEERLSGEHETSRFDEFTYGCADRTASVRIGTKTVNENKGYFEDRRPSSNMNPYLVCAALFRTSVKAGDQPLPVQC